MSWEEKYNRPPRIAEWLSRFIYPDRGGGHTLGDLAEEYQSVVQESGLFRARLWYWAQMLRAFPSRAFDDILWRTTMIKNYMKIAFRNIKRFKVYSFINILGLAIGTACCLMIILYVNFELSYDSYHEDADRIYRVGLNIRGKTYNRMYDGVSGAVGPALVKDYPQIEYAVRLMRRNNRLINYKNSKIFYENMFFYADPEIFKVFNFSFLRGVPETALGRPDTVVVTEEMAKKYFNGEDPIGRILSIDSRDHTVTGVIRNVPENSQIQYNFIASITGLRDRWDRDWGTTMFYCYIKVRENVDVENLEKEISKTADKYIGERLQRGGATFAYFLQPIKDVHVHSDINFFRPFEKYDFRFDIVPYGNPLYLYIFSVVGVLIIIIACINFVNLTTALSAKRAKEVGIRKVVGAFRIQLINQFIGESLLFVLLSSSAAVIITVLFLPYFNKITGVHFSVQDIMKPELILYVGLIILVLGAVAGSYPAFVLSSFKPVSILKGRSSTSIRSTFLRKIFVVGQFFISIVFIISTIVMNKQLHYMQTTHLGFEKEQKLILPIKTGASITDNYETIKYEFLKHTNILGAAASSGVPGWIGGGQSVRLVGEMDDMNQWMYCLFIDEDFIPEYKIEVLSGKAFSRERGFENERTYMINEAAMKAFGWGSPDEALGKIMDRNGIEGAIIGVIRDFHYEGLQVAVSPLILTKYPENFNRISLTLSAQNLPNTLSFIKDKWRELFPGAACDYYFLDDDFNLQYIAEKRTGMLINIFTFIGLSIACLGLLGLATFTAQQRTKEIGIRKVLGASSANILCRFSKEFVLLVAVASIIAMPTGYIVMKYWLQNFAFRINLGIGTFILSALLAVMIASVTVSYQSFKAATADPVDSLRYE